MKNPLNFLLIGLLFLSACSSFFKVEVYVDNPSDKVLSFTLDDKSYELMGKEHQTIKLVKGEHYIQAEQDGEVIFDGTISITQAGLINLTNSRYILHQELYLKEQERYIELAEEALDLKDVDIDDNMYQDVDFRLFEDEVFIPQQWDYSFFEELPTEIKTGSGEFAIVGKLYRQEDLEKAWGFNGNYDFTGNTDVDLQQFLDSIALQLQADTQIIN